MTNVEKGSYKWLILVGVFCGNVLTFGITHSVGVLYKNWTNYFDSSASFLSLVGSAPTAMSGLVGPIFGFLLSKFSFRQCAFGGGFLITLGLSSSFLVKTPVELLLTFGIITGFGLSGSFFVSSTMINEYFFENRMLAEGVVGSGVGFGTFMFSILQQQLSKSYTWKGAMLITGGITFHLCLISMFYVASNNIESHPLNFWKNYDRKKERQVETSKTISVIDCSTTDTEENENKGPNRNFFERSLVLWQNPLFIMIVLADTMMWLAIFIPYVHLVERGKLLENVDEDTASWLSSCIGLASIVGRPCTGLISNYFHIYPLWAFVANQMACGLSMFLSSFWSTKEGLFAFGITFGFLSNGYGFLKASTAKLLGPEKFADAFSWMLLFDGAATLAGPVIAGYIYDTTQSYLWSFRLGGFLLIFSASICLFKPLIKSLEKKRKSSGKPNNLSTITVNCDGNENVVFHP